MSGFSPAAGSSGAQIDTNPGDYVPLGDTFALGTVGQAMDAGTQLQHPSNLSPDGHKRRDWIEKDFGYLAWTGDPWGISSGQLPSGGGVIQVIRLHAPVALSVTSIALLVQTIGATLTANQNFVGLYDANKNKLGVSGDQSGAWVSVGEKRAALTGGPFAVAVGDFFVIIVSNGTTLPKFVGGGLVGPTVNLGLSAANSRFATADTGITTPATAPAALGAFSQSNAQAYFAAVL